MLLFVFEPTNSINLSGYESNRNMRNTPQSIPSRYIICLFLRPRLLIILSEWAFFFSSEQTVLIFLRLFLWPTFYWKTLCVKVFLSVMSVFDISPASRSSFIADIIYTVSVRPYFGFHKTQQFVLLVRSLDGSILLMCPQNLILSLCILLFHWHC